MRFYHVIQLGLLCMVLFAFTFCHAQKEGQKGEVLALPDKFFETLNEKAASTESNLDHQTDKYLTKLQKQEAKLRKKLYRKDSTLAHRLFNGVDDKYNNLRNGTSKLTKCESLYSGHLDSLSTALNFLKNSNLSSIASNPELQKTLDQYKNLQEKFNASDQIKKYLDQRQQLLKQQFEKLGMVKELKQFQKQVYYYRTQIQEVKQAFEDPTKLEQKLLEVVMKIPEFKSFFARNSMLSSLFALPGSGGSSTASLQGLQTRAMINQSLVDRFGSGPDVSQQLQQNIQSAQGQLNDLKSRLSQYSSGSYGNSTEEPSIPDFRPNQERTHSFRKRITYGFNIQSQKSRFGFPAMSDLGLSIGYKVRQNLVTGAGISGKVGWGQDWNHIAITFQGIGLRSYAEYQVNGSWWIAAGYETNYMRLIHSISQLQDYPAWSRSGLAGLSKRYSINKKFNGELKLLWNYLSYQERPRSNPILFRFAYSMK